MDDERKRRRNPFFDILDSLGLDDDSPFERMDSEIDSLFGTTDFTSAFNEQRKRMNEMMQKLMEEAETKPGNPLVYGVSITQGPDGKVEMRKIGNIQPTEDRVEVKDEREPLVDVIERDKEVTVLAELPGVEEKDIQLKVADGSLTIKAPKKFYKKVALPRGASARGISKTYKNGVLTVTVKKR